MRLIMAPSLRAGPFDRWGVASEKQHIVVLYVEGEGLAGLEGGKVGIALPRRAWACASIYMTKTFRLQPLARVCSMYQRRAFRSLTFCIRTTWWNHGIFQNGLLSNFVTACFKAAKLLRSGCSLFAISFTD